MRGWFDAFRHDGGPTLYDHANRTAVTGDVPTITLCVVFITLFVAFLIIFPGIRKEVSSGHKVKNQMWQLLRPSLSDRSVGREDCFIRRRRGT
jgi:Dual oxidase maturation factor